MHYSRSLLLAVASIGLVAADRPTNTSICDYYTTALLKNNTAANQLTILTLLVNTVVIGNYTKPDIPGVTFPNVVVPGILASGTVNGTKVNLLPFFNGGLASSNNGGNSGVSMNFLDDGGAAPLMKNKPADGTSSNQFNLLTHLYQFFGTLLGCSQQGMTGFASYGGDASMYEVHKFMDLSYAEVTYFIQQVGLAAESFGVASSDIQVVGAALNKLFNYRCSPATAVIPAQGPQMHSICTDNTCPIAANGTCPASQPGKPAVANSTLAAGAGNSSGTATATAPNATGSSGGTSAPNGTGTSNGAASSNVAGWVLAAALGFLALLF